MSITPAELLAKVEKVVKEGEEYNQTLIYETLGLRWGTESIVGGQTKTIVLNQPYASGIIDYVIWREVRTADDQEIEVVIVPDSKTAASFQIWAPKSGTFKYITTYPSINIEP